MHSFIICLILFLLVAVEFCQVLTFINGKMLCTEFFPAFSNLWCGIITLFLTASSIYLHFSGQPVDAKLMIVLFFVISLVQSVSWAVSEVLEWRIWMSQTANDHHLAYSMYLITICCCAIGIVLSIWAAELVYIVKIRCFHELALIKDIKTSHPANVSVGVSRCFLLNRWKAENEHSEIYKASQSWKFVYYRSSTPKRKNRLKKYSKRKSSVRSHNKSVPITDDDLNKSAPLRQIAIFNPSAVGMDHQSDADHRPNDKNNNRFNKLSENLEETVFTRRLGEKNYRAVSMKVKKSNNRPTIVEPKYQSVKLFDDKDKHDLPNFDDCRF